METGPNFWRIFWLAIPFWVVVGIGLVILFNFVSPSTKVMGYSLTDAIPVALVIVVWIGALAYVWVKRKPRA
jgi:hypothetical protein